MTQALTTTEDKLRLLSTIDIEEVVEVAADIVMRRAEPQAVAVMVWDPDLETFSDRFLFGLKKKDISRFVEAYAEEYEDGEQALSEVDVEEIDVVVPPALSPVLRYRVAGEDELVAIILIAGADEDDLKQLEEDLSLFPLALAIGHAWEYRELKRENERLRSQYEQLEESIQSMEEQTRKVIMDVQAKEALRTKKLDRERLIYSISNTVRSSLKIQEVLQTAVNQIGREFDVSHCVLMRNADENEQFVCWEYCHAEQNPIKDLFASDAGLEFMLTAVRKEAPQDLGDPHTDSQQVYNRDFLIELGLRSGLIIPLILRDTVLGAIFLQECRQIRDFEIDDAALLGSLADQLSVAIENAELHEERERQARSDGLTGVANRRHFNETLQLEFERARRHEQPLSLIVADLDFLKKINDTYGHAAGDDAIKTIARVFKQGSRAIDLAARYGGEEFCLLLPNTDLEMAGQIAERLRKQITEEPVEHAGSISASIGVASYPTHAADPDTLFQKADEALYGAKQGGRNRVCIAAGPAAES